MYKMIIEQYIPILDGIMAHEKKLDRRLIYGSMTKFRTAFSVLLDTLIAAEKVIFISFNWHTSVTVSIMVILIPPLPFLQKYQE